MLSFDRSIDTTLLESTCEEVGQDLVSKLWFSAPGPNRTAPHRTAPHRTVPYRTAPHRTAPNRTALKWFAHGSVMVRSWFTRGTLEVRYCYGTVLKLFFDRYCTYSRTCMPHMCCYHFYSLVQSCYSYAYTCTCTCMLEKVTLHSI